MNKIIKTWQEKEIGYGNKIPIINVINNKLSELNLNEYEIKKITKITNKIIKQIKYRGSYVTKKMIYTIIYFSIKYNYINKFQNLYIYGITRQDLERYKFKLKEMGANI